MSAYLSYCTNMIESWPYGHEELSSTQKRFREFVDRRVQPLPFSEDSEDITDREFVKNYEIKGNIFSGSQLGVYDYDAGMKYGGLQRSYFVRLAIDAGSGQGKEPLIELHLWPNPINEAEDSKPFVIKANYGDCEGGIVSDDFVRDVLDNIEMLEWKGLMIPVEKPAFENY